MPWNSGDAHSFTHHANTKKKKRAWKEIANKILHETGDEARAVRIANHAMHNIKSLLWQILKDMPHAAGVVDKRLTKEEANYHDVSIDLMKCKGCMMYHPLKCDLVIGLINPDGWCEHYISNSQTVTGFSFGPPS